MVMLLLLGGGNGIYVCLEGVDARGCRRRGGRVSRWEIFVFRATSDPVSAVYCIGVVVSVGRPRPRFGRPGRHLGGKVQGILGPFSARSLAYSSAPAARVIKSVSFSDVRSCQSMGYVGGLSNTGQWTWPVGGLDNVVSKTITEIWPWAWRRW